MAHVSPLEAAAALNTQDFVRAFKLDRLPILNRVSSQIMRYPARRISRTVLQFDHISGTQGVRASSQWLIRQFSAEVRVHNVEAIPTDRPLLVVSNHPGMIDAMAIWAHLPRPEVRTIAAERPILGLLPHINQHIFFVPDDPQRRSGFVRRVVRYLQGGGTILTFPAGKIEPDPNLRRYDALASLGSWSPSLDMFVRLVPDLAVVPVVVSGVISSRAVENPIARIYRTPADREWAAATLQVLLPYYRDVTVDVRFGEPIIAGNGSVRDSMRQLMCDL